MMKTAAYIELFFSDPGMGPGNGSPTATNVVVHPLGNCCCYQIFNVLKLFHFATDHNKTLSTIFTICDSQFLHRVGFLSCPN